MDAFFFPIMNAIIVLMHRLMEKFGAGLADGAVAGAGSPTTPANGSGLPSAFSSLLGELTTGFDLSTEVGKKEAYNRCCQYAKENLSQAAECNVFLAEAAEALGQMRLHMDIIEKTAAPSGAERIHVVYDGYGACEVTGNRPGLDYLSRVFRALSETPMEGEHIHFRQADPALQGNSHGLNVYFEPDEWFDRYTREYSETEEPFIPARKIAAGAVIALCVTVDFPPMFYMSRDKIYRVVKCEEYDGREGPAFKRIRDSIARMDVFTLVDDRGEELKFAFDLDDSDVVFFTMGDLEQLIQ